MLDVQWLVAENIVDFGAQLIHVLRVLQKVVEGKREGACLQEHISVPISGYQNFGSDFT
jgi:hypothetical protein